MVELKDKTVEELRKMASRKKIEGRSKMNKTELVRALKKKSTTKKTMKRRKMRGGTLSVNDAAYLLTVGTQTEFIFVNGNRSGPFITLGITDTDPQKLMIQVGALPLLINISQLHFYDGILFRTVLTQENNKFYIDEQFFVERVGDQVISSPIISYRREGANFNITILRGDNEVVVSYPITRFRIIGQYMYLIPENATASAAAAAASAPRQREAAAAAASSAPRQRKAVAAPGYGQKPAVPGRKAIAEPAAAAATFTNENRFAALQAMVNEENAERQRVLNKIRQKKEKKAEKIALAKKKEANNKKAALKRKMIQNTQGSECPICLEELVISNNNSNLNNPNRVIQLKSCSHYFHKNCIEGWCRDKNICLCPICRTEVEMP